MFISRTTRAISQIPGVSTFRSLIQQDPPPEDRKISMAPCSSCKKVFEFPQCTPWQEIERIIEEHCLGCDKKRATASANAKKRWAKEKQRRLAAHPEPPQTADINIKQKRRARAEEKAKTSTKTCRTLQERKVLLEEDPWTVTETLDPKHVECVACGHWIGLDKRRLYYPGLWFKHKERCTGIDQRFVRGDVMLRPIIRRRFMLQVNPPHKAFHDPDAYFPKLSLQMRRRRLRYGVLKGYASTSRVLLRRVKVATASLAEHPKEKDDDKAREVVGRVAEEGATCSEAEVVPPTKTSSSTWWTTVLGPGTGESQPIAGGHVVGSPIAHQERLRAEHGSTWRLKESPVETAFDETTIEYDQLKARCDHVQSSRDRDFRIFGRSSQPTFRVSCGSTSSSGSGHWKVRGDVRRHEYYGTYASLANISVLNRRASPVQPSMYSPSPVVQNRYSFNYASSSPRPESRPISGYVPRALEFGYYLP